MHGFIQDHAAGAVPSTPDDHPSYRGLPRHYAVKHSAGEYVRGQVSVNGVESFWATLKRAHKGVFHHFSVKHLHRYITEFAGRHNVRDLDTIEQLTALARRHDRQAVVLPGPDCRARLILDARAPFL